MTGTRERTRTTLLVGLVALGVVFLLVVRTSRAAFTATTDNRGNSFVAGDVVLSDDDAGASALFAETAFVPGETVQDCIAVRYEGTIPDPGPVVLYSGGFVDVPGPDPASVGLADHLLLTVEEGDGGRFGDCSGFAPSATIVGDAPLSSFGGARTDYASGAGVWDPSSSPETRTYRFSVTLDEASVPNEEQGAGVQDLVFVWEVMS